MNVEIQNTLTLRGENKAAVPVDTTGWSAAFIEYLIAYGWDVRMQRCTANAKDTDEFKEKEKKMLASMKAGELPHKGGSGSGTSLEDKIAHKFLSLMGVKGKVGELDERWLTFSKSTVLNSVDDMAQKAAIMKDPDQLTALAVEYMDAVQDSATQTPEWEKIRAELTEKPTATTIKITIGGK